jgi:hypothetical protein
MIRLVGGVAFDPEAGAFCWRDTAFSLPIGALPDIRGEPFRRSRGLPWTRESIAQADLWPAAIAQSVEHVIRNDGVGGSNPSCGTSLIGSIPETWVTDYSGHIGNTFGPKGFASDLSPQVSSSKFPKSQCTKMTRRIRSSPRLMPSVCPASMVEISILF